MTQSDAPLEEVYHSGKMTAAFLTARPWRLCAPDGTVESDALRFLPNGTVEGIRG